ncbi:MAG: UDP-N-acetylmuramoyl-L-alanyl-D-glutamate--2,6-diaminopimelate ligase [Hyphomicrobiales bacterium]
MLAKLMEGDGPPPKGAGALPITGITEDSRQVRPGFLFAALPGVKADGARFIPQAVQAGAVAVLCLPGVSVPQPAVVLADANPRRMLAHMAARFSGAQPDLVVAVTGTNGKTSIAAFVRQIWASMGFRAASLGTIGVVGPEGEEYLAHTTPDPVKLHATLARLAADHVTHLALEASSHGLDQYRLDGVRLSAGAFTNITRDHLDYHPSFEAYFDAKMRLFEDLLPPGAPAIINMDSPHGAEVARRARAHGLMVLGVGEAGDWLRIVSIARDGFGQRLEVEGPGGRHEMALPLAGEFQASNALIAAGLVIATGGEETLAIHALESLKGARGRLDHAGTSKLGAPIFVDYAHTPDALQTALLALRPYVTGKLIVVFGAGGDRDKGKRPQMGAIAAKFADRAYVTDDNPRGEVPATIRAEIMAACPGGIEIGDRAKAIRRAIEGLEHGDVLLVAGKGHEPGQIVGKEILPFSDHDAVAAGIRGEDYHG